MFVELYDEDFVISNQHLLHIPKLENVKDVTEALAAIRHTAYEVFGEDFTMYVLRSWDDWVSQTYWHRKPNCKYYLAHTPYVSACIVVKTGGS